MEKSFFIRQYGIVHVAQNVSSARRLLKLICWCCSRTFWITDVRLFRRCTAPAQSSYLHLSLFTCAHVHVRVISTQADSAAVSVKFMCSEKAGVGGGSHVCHQQMKIEVYVSQVLSTLTHLCGNRFVDAG